MQQINFQLILYIAAFNLIDIILLVTYPSFHNPMILHLPIKRAFYIINIIHYMKHELNYFTAGLY